MKKIVSTLLVAAMLLSSFMALGAFADNTTIEAINSSNVSQGYYSTIDAAANAAGVNGTVRLSAGTFEFNGRQTIAVEGVTLEGAGRGQTFIKTSLSYQYGSDTNKKALLTIAANNVKVKDLSVDASVYGDTITSATDFIVVRINSGSGIELNNVYVTGSPRTLIKIGTNSDSATVTADNLYCDAEYKAIPQLIGEDYTNVYSDIDVNRGTFTLNSGAVHGFIKAEGNGTFVNNAANGNPKYYKLTRRFIFVDLISVTTTTKHFVYSYDNVREIEDEDNMDTFIKVVKANKAKLQAMTNEAVSLNDQELIGKFITMLTDVLNDGYDSDIDACRTQLQNVYVG